MSDIQLIPYIKSAQHYVAVGVIRHLCIQRGSLMLAYLICLILHNFFMDFRKQKPVSNFRLNSFIYREVLTGKFKPNRFLKTSFHAS